MTLADRPVTGLFRKYRLTRHRGNRVEQSTEVRQCDGSVQRRLGLTDVGSTLTWATGAEVIRSEL
jgi:hypothetical protein